MKGNLYLIWDEATNGRSIAIGVSLTSISGLATYGVVFRVLSSLTLDDQTSIATALGVSLCVIIGVALGVNRVWGTSRNVEEGVPAASDLQGVLSGMGTDPHRELQALLRGPPDIRQLAEDTGILNQLRELCDEAKPSSPSEAEA